MKRVIILSVFLFSGLAISSSYEIPQSECGEMDVRKNASPAVREHLSKPQDQGYMGWCYGYTGADLLSLEVETPLSAAHMSSIYNKSIRSDAFWKAGYSVFRLFTGRETYEGGLVGKAMSEAMKVNPVCAHNEHDAESAFVLVLEKFRREYKNNERSSEEVCSILQYYFPGLDTNTEKFMEDFVTHDMNDQLEGFLRVGCKEKVEVPQKKSITFNKPLFFGKKSHASRVNELLNRGKAFGITYPAGSVAKNISGLHVSSVIGRRWNNGRCEYNIRNSWGRLCPYNEGIECNEDDGSYWLNDQDFFKMSLSFSYLE